MRLLEGVVEEVESPEVAELRAANRELRAELSRVRFDTERAAEQASRAVAGLRKQLLPLYRALQAVFGEIDAIGASNDGLGVNAASDPRVATVWAAWKSRIGGQPAQLIDAFLLHGEMTATQIAIAIGIHPKNVAQVVHKLNKAGLIQKNGGKYSLKAL